MFMVVDDLIVRDVIYRLSRFIALLWQIVCWNALDKIACASIGQTKRMRNERKAS